MEGPEDIKRACAEMKGLERQMDELLAKLAAQRYAPGDRLVDSAGFPRSDVDVYTIRHLASEYRAVQGRHAALRKRVEDAVLGGGWQRG